MDRKNILIIVADQLTWRALPVYGSKYARTPAINEISDGAAVFERCYTPCPLCQPARAAMWTGLYPHETKVLSNGLLWPQSDIPNYMSTIGETFRDAGYDTVYFGKKHDLGSLRGFTCAEEKKLPIEQHNESWPLNMDTFRDRYTTQEAVRYLKEKQDKPFVMAVGYHNPHNICGYVGANEGPHENVPVENLPELPENFQFDDFENRPKCVQYICCSHNRQAQVAGWTPENFRHYLAAYYHYLELVDSEISQVLSALREREDYKDTLIVFTADHGDSMAARGRVTKQVDFYEEVTRVPLIIKGPGVKPGRIREGSVSLLDLYPTLCAYAGIPMPDGLRGIDLSEALYRGALQQRLYVASQWHTEWGYTVEPGRMLINGQYKYIKYIEDQAEELYDLDKDPYEKKNLLNCQEYEEALIHMRMLFKRYLEETTDPFETLQWSADPRWRSHKAGYQNHTGKAAAAHSWELYGRPSGD